MVFVPYREEVLNTDFFGFDGGRHVGWRLLGVVVVSWRREKAQGIKESGEISGYVKCSGSVWTHRVQERG